MVNYLGFTLIKLPNNQRYNKMTILKLFHKKKSTICLLVAAPEIRAWERTLGPTEEKKIPLFKLLWVPVLQRPNKPVPRFQLWIHQLLSPLLQATATAPLPSPPYTLQFSAWLHLFRIIIFWSLHFRNITCKDMICIFMQFICQIC